MAEVKAGYCVHYTLVWLWLWLRLLVIAVNTVVLLLALLQ